MDELDPREKTLTSSTDIIRNRNAICEILNIRNALYITNFKQFPNVFGSRYELDLQYRIYTVAQSHNHTVVQAYKTY